MLEDVDRCYRAVQSRDPRFDGWFFTAVTSTGIFCRPSCPARTPDRRHVRFYPTAAAAQQAGFRACLRCRPDAAPGSPAWNGRADVVARAMRLVADGLVDREGVSGLAAHLGYGVRHLHRLLVSEVGAGPLALARAQRAQTARVLVETTALPMAHVAFAAGFSSVRQFNDTVLQLLGRTPGELRRRACAGPRSTGPGAITLRLPYRSPMAAAELLGYLQARAVPGVEAGGGGVFARSLQLPHGHGAVALRAADGYVDARAVLADLRDLTALVGRCRRLLDLDADPEAVDAALGDDPALCPLVRATPGRRLPGAVDGFELAARAVIGQQVSVQGATRVAGRLVAAAGPPLTIAPDLVASALGALPGLVTCAFPSPADLLCAPDAAFAMPASRRDTLRRLAAAVAGGRLVIDPGADPDRVAHSLGDMAGIGPWTVAYVRMRALGDPDAFMPTDLGVRRGMERVGLASDPAGSLRAAERWRPWRAYAMTHLWAAGRGASVAAHSEATRPGRAGLTTPAPTTDSTTPTTKPDGKEVAA